MLGRPKPRLLDLPIAVSLDALVPAGNVFRHLEAKLDLGFERGWFGGGCAGHGRPSIDLVVFIKLHQEVVDRAAAARNRCPVRAASTASDRGRSVRRSFLADDLGKVLGYHATEAHRKAIRERRFRVE